MSCDETLPFFFTPSHSYVSGVPYRHPSTFEMKIGKIFAWETKFVNPERRLFAGDSQKSVDMKELFSKLFEEFEWWYYT